MPYYITTTHSPRRTAGPYETLTEARMQAIRVKNPTEVAIYKGRTPDCLRNDLCRVGWVFHRGTWIYMARDTTYKDARLVNRDGTLGGKWLA